VENQDLSKMLRELKCHPKSLGFILKDAKEELLAYSRNRFIKNLL
jgi:hypothetical protein